MMSPEKYPTDLTNSQFKPLLKIIPMILWLIVPNLVLYVYPWLLHAAIPQVEPITWIDCRLRFFRTHNQIFLAPLLWKAMEFVFLLLVACRFRPYTPKLHLQCRLTDRPQVYPPLHRQSLHFPLAVCPGISSAKFADSFHRKSTAMHSLRNGCILQWPGAWFFICM